MTNNEYFKQQLRRGQEIEEEAIKLIENKFNVKCIKRQDETNYKTVLYDFKTDDNIKYEVKADFRSEKTGNFYIEFVGYGKLSGINITKADKHILKSGYKYYIITTEILKTLIRTDTKNKFPTRYTRDRTTGGFLIPIDIIKNNCEFILNA